MLFSIGWSVNLTSLNNTIPDGRPSTVPADTGLWSAQSQNSVPCQFGWVTHYTDKEYVCRTCGAPCIFTAQDQKYTYEVKKAYIDQERKLCRPCWNQSNAIAEQIKPYVTRWAAEKNGLQNDIAFLAEWLELLTERERNLSGRFDIAQKNVLIKLIRKAGAR
ncbi:hypothetical protein CR152_14010 [Massilia violaceinigra]|uniref:Probable zinc-binding domain-containing protein n=1 Tax=Massilia violaceinigra TaxID=2045208 RepID=A0A2D2DKK1_9BURK|nr:hypothetical protein CR152_14010 [Massilia violaceinigra]